MRVYFVVLALLTTLFLAFVLWYPFPADIDMHNYESGIKNAYKMLGCILGFWMAYEIDVHYTHFETKGVWWVQLIKIAGGLILVLLVKSLLKTPLNAVFGESVGRAVRYALIVISAGVVWPLTFQPLSRLCGKQSNRTQ